MSPPLPFPFASDAAASSPAPKYFARNRYLDVTRGMDAVKLLPGEYYVATSKMLLVTVLGSCVAACIRDVRLGIGGMNHFMLPDSEAGGASSRAARYGVYAMELLIGHLLKLGAQREHLEARLFGGGNVMPELARSNIGHKNAAFALEFLKIEGIRVVSSDLAAWHSRKVYYFPATGKARVFNVKPHSDTVLERERAYRDRLLQEVGGGSEAFRPPRSARRNPKPESIR